jgi:3',5'-cyclic-AMP phosphodiesterase
VVRKRLDSFRSALAGCFISALAVCCLASCDYGINQIFGRGDTVQSRSLDASGRGAVIAAQEALLEKAVPRGTAFSFVVAADLHFSASKGPRAAALDGFINLAKDSGADFALFGGDLTNTGVEEEYRLFLSFADSLKAGTASHLGEGRPLPWFAAVGNHDLYNSGWTYFNKYIGPSNERFRVGSDRFYCIDTGSGSVGEAQLEDLGSAMQSDASPKIVLSHYPVHGSSTYSYYRITNTRERAELISMFNTYGVQLLLCGHWHQPDTANCGKFTERIIGSLTDTKSDGRAHAVLVKVASDGSIISCDSYTF